MANSITSDALNQSASFKFPVTNLLDNDSSIVAIDSTSDVSGVNNFSCEGVDIIPSNCSLDVDSPTISDSNLIYGEKYNCGWYYDKQRENNLTSVRLYANTLYSADNTWSKKDGYIIWLRACDSILYDDFRIQINNNWTDVGTDIVGDTINAALKAVAPYRKMVGDGIANMKRRKDDKMRTDTNYRKQVEGSTLSNFLSKSVDKAADLNTRIKQSGVDIDTLLNSNLVTQGAQYTYYGGSGIDFGNLDMKFTIFPKFGIYSGKFISVTDQVTQLYPYFVGRLIDFKDSGLAGNGSNTLSKIATSDELNKFFKVQLAPMGYKASAENIDVGIDGKGLEGTFEMRIGAYYTISNLVITNVSLNFSKYMVKNPMDGTISPLYCDISLLFKPATKYSNEALIRFVSGVNSKDVETKLKEKLENSKTNVSKETYPKSK